MAGSDSFAVEQGKAQEAVEWMNAYAKKNKLKFEAKLSGHSIQTIRFGSFEMIAWTGDWSSARNIIQKASGKLKARVIESGYREKRDLLSAMFSSGTEYAKIYSNGKIAGQITLENKSGRWAAGSEAYV